MSEQLEYIKKLLQSCFIPELKENFDDTPLENFQQYHQLLDIQLPILYDFVQQHEQLIFGKQDEETVEVHACLIVLLCEISATNAVYRVKNESLIKNANRLLHRHDKQDANVEEIIFRHYQQKLSNNCWKKQLGAIHGYVRYLEFRYNEITRNKYKMPQNWINFSLSFGLRVHECHEPIYKQLGIRIFHLMLNYSKHEDIKEQNIHCVIYDAVFKDVHFMNTVVATADIWSCLFKCLDFFYDIDSLNWSQADDMMEALLRNIPMAPDSLISICLLKFVTKLGAYFTINREEIESKCHCDLNLPAMLEQCRSVCLHNNSYTSFRWAKSILNLFVIESYKLMQSANICRQLLQEIHRCYMVCIMPIPVQIAESLLLAFYDKFTNVLMEVIVVQKKELSIRMLIKSILETLYLHLKDSPICDEYEKLVKYRDSFEKLLQNEIFQFAK